MKKELGIFFFFINFFVSLLGLEAKTLLVSDIDDTVKKSNSGSFLGSLSRLHAGAFDDTRDFVNSLKESENPDIAYVSGSYKFMYNGSHWLKRHKFPEGEVHQRKLGDGDMKDFKVKTITEFIEKRINAGTFDPNKDTIYLLGDNQSYDQEVYREVTKNLGLKKADIRIRNIKVALENDGKLKGSCFGADGLCVNMGNRNGEDLVEKAPRFWRKRIKEGILEGLCNLKSLSQLLRLECITCVDELVKYTFESPDRSLLDYLNLLVSKKHSCVSEEKHRPSLRYPLHRNS